MATESRSTAYPSPARASSSQFFLAAASLAELLVFGWPNVQGTLGDWRKERGKEVHLREEFVRFEIVLIDLSRGVLLFVSSQALSMFFVECRVSGPFEVCISLIHGESTKRLNIKIFAAVLARCAMRENVGA